MGCLTCEVACAVAHTPSDRLASAMLAREPLSPRTRVVEVFGKRFPMQCRQCEDAPCMIGCPVKALTRNMEMGRVEVDYDKCIGCRTCVSVCPFGAMHFVPTDRKVIKCDLCDGDPQCVRFCDVKAVRLVEAGDVSLQKGREAARRIQAADHKASTLVA